MEPQGGEAMDFRVLGALEVTRDGRPVALGGARERALLALLLLHANEVVPRGRIVDALWDESPPETAPNAVQVAVHRLRRVLGPGRLETRGAGYVLHVADGELDVARVESLRREAASLEGQARAEALRDALAVWRGPGLADLRETPFGARAADRLDELRLTVLAARVDAELEAGRAEELVPELTALVREHPFRERFHAQRMLALYRTGRQAEALEAYARARRVLVDELGIEPSADLRALERRILEQDPSLAGAPASAAHGNLPVAPTRLVGRELELAAVTALLGRPDVRLLTLTGAGGTGKTRLAVEAARGLAPRFADGVWFVGLAPVRDPALVASTVAATLGVGETGSATLLEELTAHLRGRRTLLLLDNLEHLQAAAPLVAELLAAAPGLNVLVTSRSVLRLSGEHDYPVPPLPLPAPSTDPDLLLENDAVALFVERARAVRPGFRLNGEAAAVADICVALDGLPLALELAAARTKLLTPTALRARLERRLPLLDRGPADVPGRQRTMRATIDWSYALLGADEQTLFARLSVFAGGCTIEAAETICGAHLDAATALVDSSLLRERPGRAGELRFVMLETLREYAAERLDDGGERASLAHRHTRYYVELAETAEARLAGADAAAWLERLDAEHDNLRAALAWAASSGDTELEHRLVAALRHFWRLRGHLTEGRGRLDAALGRSDDSIPPGLRARALNAAWVLLADTGRGRGLLEQALALFREAGDEAGAARTLAELGGMAALEGDYAEAARRYRETIPLFRATGDGRALCVTTGNLAAVLSLAGEYAQSREVSLEALELCRTLGDRDQTCVTLHNLARGSLREGRTDEAVGFLVESTEITAELGYREVLANCLEAFAEIELAAGRDERAARLLGVAESILAELGAELGPEERVSYEGALERLGARLGARLEELRAEGARLDLGEAVTLALAARRADG